MSSSPVFVTVYCDIDKDSKVIQDEEWVLLIVLCICYFRDTRLMPESQACCIDITLIQFVINEHLCINCVDYTSHMFLSSEKSALFMVLLKTLRSCWDGLYAAAHV
jgi:hypothetical protein